jgi:hypothetical protein
LTNAGADAPDATVGGGIGATSRAAGQFDVFVKDTAGNLNAAWWA